MGYLIPNSSPSVTVNGRTIAVAAFYWSNIAGAFYVCGVFEDKADGWNNISSFVYNDRNLLSVIQQKGGSVKFLAWVKAEINKRLADMFGAPPPPEVTEPTTDAEADAFMVSSFAQLKLTLVNGVPVLG